ncbi:nuclear transport factor 2 family protein [Streptosporangium sp. NPDC020145]|uniref:nuclear transport factor 2 family protein n=1 Tax=Streptosporangium sp. NPDC020145 TaxID=3154694 RepID=UPI003428FAED
MTTERATALTDLMDKEELRGLLVRGWRALDHKDYDTWIGCWTEDAELAFGPWEPLHGARTIKATVIEAEDSYAAMFHYLLNTHFEIDGDRATGVGYMLFVGVPDTAEADAHFDMGGSYTWEFVRADAGWRVARQHLTMSWTSGVDSLGSFS